MSTLARRAFAARIHAMTDTEFAEYLADTISAEQAVIDAQITQGATFICSAGGKLHTLQCLYSGHYPARRDTYNAFSHDPAHLQERLAQSGPLRMPALLGPQEIVNDDRTYGRCGLCKPDVPEYRTQDQPRSASELTAALKAHVDTHNTRPHIALLATMRLHYAPTGHPCPADNRPSPCPTTTVILRSYGIKP